MDNKTARCGRCGRVLRDPLSIAIGLGPVCRGGSSGKSKSPRPRVKIGKGVGSYTVSATNGDGPLPAVIHESDDDLQHLGIPLEKVQEYP